MTTAVRSAPVQGSSAPAGRRLASTVRLPWFVGLAALLAVATVLGVLGGRDATDAGVPRAVLDAEEAAAVGVAQQVRRSLNEGSDDLAQIARALEVDIRDDQVRPDRAVTALRATSDWHFRYLALGLVDARTGRWTLQVPGEAAAAPLERLPDDRRLVKVLDDGRLIETVPVRDGRRMLVAAVYDPAFLYPDLQPRPAAAYVVDDRQRAVAAPGGAGLAQRLPTPLLQAAADRAGKVSGHRAGPAAPGRSLVAAYAPVTGVGPAGAAGLGVVLVRDVQSTSIPASFRLAGGSAALLLALLACALFWWLHRSVVRPVLELQGSAERVGYGDLSRPVEVVRDDEIGVAGRALERLRLALIRARVQDMDPHGEEGSPR